MEFFGLAPGDIEPVLVFILVPLAVLIMIHVLKK